MEMPNLNRRESSPAPKKGEKLTVLDLGFHTGQIVRFTDPSSKKLSAGKIAGVGFDPDGNPEVAIEVPNYGLLTIPQEEFLKQQEVQDLADGVNNLLN